MTKKKDIDDKSELLEFLKHEKVIISFNRILAELDKIPTLIPDFITTYLVDDPPETMLILWPGFESAEQLLSPLVTNLKPKKVYAIDQLLRLYDYREPNDEDEEIFVERNGKKIRYEEDDIKFKSLDEVQEDLNKNLKEYDKISGIPIEWIFGDVTQELNLIEEKVDLIVGYEPFYRPLVSDDEQHRLNERVDNIILQSSELLNPNGVLIIIVVSDLFKKFPNLFNDLEQAGLNIESALQIPKGYYLSTFFLSRTLLTIRKGKQRKIFIAELSENKDSIMNIIQNLNSLKPGQMPQLGLLVDPNSFEDLPDILLKRSIETAVKRFHFKTFYLSEIVEKINIINKDNNSTFVEKENSIYFSMTSDHPIESSLVGLKLEQYRYAQLILNSKLTSSFYVKNLLNSSFGKKIVKKWHSKLTNKNFKEGLLSCTIYLPDIIEQNNFVNLFYKIDALSKQLESFSLELWEQPGEFKKIEEILNELNYEKSFKEWISSWIATLPFPLASILYLYLADINKEHKVIYLLRFFEALSIFNAMIMLSIFKIDDNFFNEKHGNWIEKDPKYKDWIIHPSFGNWNKIGRKLSKVLRMCLNDKENKNFYIELFRLPEGYLSAISKKGLYSVLEETTTLRNLIAHGGILEEKTINNYLFKLEKFLSEVIKVIGNVYKEIFLIEPIFMEKTKGVYNHTVRIISGANPIFETKKFDLLEEMDKDHLYLLSSEQKRPIIIQFPFVKLFGSPKNVKNACYFYSGKEKGQFKFVSYQFGEEPKMLVDDKELERAIDLFYSEEES